MPRHLALLDGDALARVTAEQDGVVSRSQLATVGYHCDAVAHRVRTQRWQRAGPRVIVLTTGALTFRQRLWVAVLHSGPGAALAGLTATEAEGLRTVTTPVLHTWVPHGSGALRLSDPQSGVTVVPHQSRRLAPELVHPTRRPARLRLPEAVVDAAEHAASHGRAQLIVLSAVQQRLVTPADLDSVLAARPRVLRRAVITTAVGYAAGGAHSLPERDWSQSVRRHGLPAPARQVKVQRPDGTWYLDADFPAYGVGVEINGSQHVLVGAVSRDDHRRNVLSTRGRLVITLSSETVRRRPGAAVVATAAALLARGWTPAARTYAGLAKLAAMEGMDLATGDVLR